MKEVNKSNAPLPVFNSLKMVFSVMTVFAIAFFTVFSAINLPYGEKSTECIVNTITSNIEEIGSGAVTSLKDIPNIKSELLSKKLGLCNLYNEKGLEITDPIYKMEWTGDTRVIFFTYFAIGFLILLGTFIKDFSSWIDTLIYYNSGKRNNKRRKK